MNQALRIVCYLKNAPGCDLFYQSNIEFKIQAFLDSDWATCATTHYSVFGFCIFIGTSLISWKSKKQSTVSRSSTEAEYRSLAYLMCELQWIQYILCDLHLSIPTPYVTFCDNSSEIQIAKNPTFHERTKHVEIDCHLIRQKILDGLIHLLHVPSTHQLADVFYQVSPSYTVSHSCFQAWLRKSICPA